MTFAQLVASAADGVDYKAIAQGLAAILAGILGFIGQRMIRTVDAMGTEIKAFSKKIHDWNNDIHGITAHHELRIETVEQEQVSHDRRLHAGEAESTAHHDRLTLLERRKR